MVGEVGERCSDLIAEAPNVAKEDQPITSQAKKIKHLNCRLHRLFQNLGPVNELFNLLT